MKRPPQILALVLIGAAVSSGWSHEGHEEITSSAVSIRPVPVGPFSTPEWFLAQATPRPIANASIDAEGRTDKKPPQASVFETFKPAVQLRWDERCLYIEHKGLPAHPMMIGITNWQQQVPLPQNYTGNNAWQLPLHPKPAATPVSIKGRFLRGAIAIAANGIPIFNPQNNRGEVAAEIGELDQWGGHCGRADDYHYHAAPLHLQGKVGAGQPIAFALDGYPILGLNEEDGSAPGGLDSFNGHSTAKVGYHYHASTKYPYINGGFRGEVVEIGGQVDPQPRAQPVREALPALRGAKITSFETTANQTTKLGYELNGEKRAVVYSETSNGSYTFEFQNGSQGIQKQSYSPRAAGNSERPPQPPPRGEAALSAKPQNGPPAPPAPARTVVQLPETALPRHPGFALKSSAILENGVMPEEYSGDGPGATLPLEWSGAPNSTKSYTLVMHHLDPEGKTKWYWILYNIPPDALSLKKNSKGVGVLGTNFKGQLGYEPPHSKGPGAKTYVITLYALSGTINPEASPSKVDYDAITQAMRGKILAATDLKMTYTRTGNGNEGPPPRRGPEREPGAGDRPGQPPPR